MKKKITLLLLVIVIVFVAYQVRQSWFTRYEMVELPVLEGYVASSGLMINNQGYVLGECLRPDPNASPSEDEEENMDVLWNRAQEPIPIQIDGYFNALNDANQIAGYVGDTTFHQACVYDTTSGLRIIDIPDATQTWGCDINNEGTVLVYGTVVSETGWETGTVFGWDIREEKEIFRFPLLCSWVNLELNDEGTVAGIIRRPPSEMGDLFRFHSQGGLEILKDTLSTPGSVNLNDQGTISFRGDFKNYIILEGDFIDIHLNDTDWFTATI
ncbi:MAG: hypothetical protein KC931_27250, partial [Candidatus Omnitrophica bacterium]|nr:hypothetical protein [Candidatus Omnitrophota bacterium]